MVLRHMMWAAPMQGMVAKPEKWKEDLLAAGQTVIRAFTLMEVEIACKGWSKWEKGDKTENGKRDRDICAVKRGYGMAINEMHPIEGASLYSVLSKLPRVIPASLQENCGRAAGYLSRYHSIENVIQKDSLPFFVASASPDTVIDLDAATLDGDEQPTQARHTIFGVDCANIQCDSFV